MPDTTSATSNSVFQGTEDGPDTPANNRILVQIIKHVYEVAGTMTRCDLKTETQWNATQLYHFLDRLEGIVYAELIGDSGRQMIVQTSRGEFLARGRQ